MDTNRRRKPRGHSTEDLAFVKAAAWAWYQHGNSSVSEGKAIITSELSATRTRRDPKPSRYKLEALRMASSQEAMEGSPVHTRKLSLLDAYEVRSISMRLDSLIAESRSTHNNKLSNNAFGSACASLDDNGSKRSMRKKKKKKKVGNNNGFWVRHSVICSTREEDVVDGRKVSAKRVDAVLLPKCLPRAKSAM